MSTATDDKVTIAAASFTVPAPSTDAVAMLRLTGDASCVGGGMAAVRVFASPTSAGCTELDSVVSVVGRGTF